MAKSPIKIHHRYGLKIPEFIDKKLTDHQYDVLELELASTHSDHRTKIFFQIESHSLAQRWAQQLWNALKDPELKVEKNYLFHGWLHAGRDLKFLCAELDQHITRLNEYFSGPPVPSYVIKESVRPETVDQDILNRVHRHFEILIGHSWNHSSHYLQAPDDIRHSIGQLNWLVHEIENLQRSLERMSHGLCQSHLFISFASCQRDDLQPADYAHFDPHMDFGDMVLHYSQVGKGHLDAFHSKDEIIDMSSVNGLRYLTGEFDISFRDATRGEINDWMPAFREWMQQKGLDPDDRALGIGFARIGFLDRSHFPQQSSLEILRFLHGFNDLAAVKLHGSRRSIARSFDENPQRVPL